MKPDNLQHCELQHCEVTIVNKLGLHARAAAKLVTLASRFQSDIRLQKGAREVNGKSIMGVLMLAAAQGSQVQLRAQGRDAIEALEELCTLVANRFGEDA
jgi:phosphocarrier protein HPr